MLTKCRLCTIIIKGDSDNIFLIYHEKGLIVK